MADAPAQLFTAHALAVFKCCSHADERGALAAAAAWQQQQPCLLSKALMQWFRSRAAIAPKALDVSSHQPAATDAGSEPAKHTGTTPDGAVYCNGASAFDLFASNGGNVRCAPLFLPPFLSCESRHAGPLVRKPQHTRRSSVHAIEPDKPARHWLWFGISSRSHTVQVRFSSGISNAVTPAAGALQGNVGPRPATSQGASACPASPTPPHPNQTRPACLFTSLIFVARPPPPPPPPVLSPFPARKLGFHTKLPPTTAVFKRSLHLLKINIKSGTW
jgi:hypothetical protein